ncbi:MAG: endonuclease MutS2 [Clostridiales bacterium]|nr:endonuclease MutS2 [Clostridiales bacterium]
MVSKKVLNLIGFDKILEKTASYAVLRKSKEEIKEIVPFNDIKTVKFLLQKTKEAYDLLFNASSTLVPFFEDVDDELSFAKKGGVLNNAQILKVARVLKASRIIKTNLDSLCPENTIIKEISSCITLFNSFEEEIYSKIISEDEISDRASPELFNIRKNITLINNKIKNKLNSYIRGLSGYLQDSLITIRENRYVLPVKSEFRGQVKGLIHDQSSSGATVFIEPTEIVELNNELKSAILEEELEIKKILADLSLRISLIETELKYNIENLIDIDILYAKATYAFKTKSIMPDINDTGFISIKRGRHPLIDENKVIPVSVSLGKDYNFLLVTGPNTGGKTVTLKLVGLLTVMAMSGFFILADDESAISIFDSVYCDIGDEQSIEQNLSTFSSHMTNIINITNSVTNNSLVLIDEIGAGTDPDEGAALGLAIIEKLLSKNCFGIITTHYSKLKEYAMTSRKIKNASMDFDNKTFSPLYKLNIGMPGLSNAIEIAKRLGISKEISDRAIEFLSDNKISFENVLREAEESKHKLDELSLSLEKMEKEKAFELEQIKKERENVQKQAEKINTTARLEVKRILNERLDTANKIIEEITEIFNKEELNTADFIKARTLRNSLEDIKYVNENFANDNRSLKKIEVDKLKVGDRVFVKSLDGVAKVLKIKDNKKEVDLLFGNLTVKVSIKDLFYFDGKEVKTKQKSQISVSRKVEPRETRLELNIVGYDTVDGLMEVERFIAESILLNAEEVKIIHGVGTGKLRVAVMDYLKKHKFVESFRTGKYGEGERGVTIVRLK